MELERAYIEELVSKLKDGTLTESELQTLIGWYNSFDDSQYAFDTTFAANAAILKERLKQKIQARINPLPAIPVIKKKSFVWLKLTAASIAIGIGLIVLTNVKKRFKAQILTADQIKPGYNQATLTLANGKTISLDSAQSGIIIGDKNINYQSGESILGRHPGLDPGSLSAMQDSGKYLVLSTPKGGQYQIILSDGTKVWLNAASTLKYPSRFSGDKREVFLEGEGYFEVNNKGAGARGLSASGAMPRVPFIVKTKNQEILVLGTSFNISSYSGEESVRTTLVTGAVQVASEKGSNTLKLSPGEQSTLSKGTLTKGKADLYSATSWKDNKFSFDNKTFEQIMRELGRWYNLDIRYEGPVPTATLFGDAYRNNNLSFVLHLLDNGGFKYRLEGRTLIIQTQKEGANP